MKKLFLFVLIFEFLTFLSNGQIINDSFYSTSLDKNTSLDVYLPPGYYENPTYYYPTIYYLHGWNGNQNSAGLAMVLADSLITYNIIEPSIIVCPNNNSDPFQGSFYTNSVVNGDYETYSIVDVINYIESSYRAYPKRSHRTLMGQSMGGYGCFHLGIKYNEVFRGIAAHGSPLNFDFIITDAIAEIKTENAGGPPYFYDYYNTGLFTKMVFAMSAAFTPNPSNTQTHINPTIVEFPLDDQGILIDSIYQKWKPFDPQSVVSTLSNSDSLAILFGDGSFDNLHLYPANLAFKDTLEYYGLDFEFYSHQGGHAMPDGFRDRGLKFLDSIMPPPGEINCGDPSNITILNISQTSADFSWSGEWNSSKWNILIDTLGFDTTDVSPVEVTSKSYQLTGLLPNTNYQFYIQTFCTVGGLSSWVGPVNFKTFCDPLTADYSEDFEENNYLPECWFQISPDTSLLVAVSDSLSLSGSKSVVLFNDTIASGFYGLATPELTEMGTIPIEVRFSARTYSDSSLLFIGTMGNPYDTSSWKGVDTVIIVDQYQTYSIKIDTLMAGSDRFIALRHSLDSSYIFLDDFLYVASDKKIDGYFNYYNNPKTPLKGLSLDLVRDSAIISATTTDDNGHFEFSEIPNGTYAINVTTTLATGGVNSLDAGKANLWWTSPIGIERIRWNAGDVDSSGSINATDAGKIQQNFVFGTSFDRGEWTFWKQNDISVSNPPTTINNISINEENISQNFYGLCVGDFKGDFIPNFTPRVSASDLILINDGTIISKPEKEVELPIKVSLPVQIAALSLIFEIPSKQVTVRNVHLNNNNLSSFPLDFNVIENELKIGWNSSKPIDFDAGNILITLTLQTAKDFYAGDEIKIELKTDPRNQLANAEFDAIENVVLSASTIVCSPTGLSEIASKDSLTVEAYPNPFQKSTFINYYIPMDGEVSLEVYNINGICLEKLVDKFQKQGSYAIKYSALNNEPGIYSVILRVNAKDKVISRTRKIVKNSN